MTAYRFRCQCGASWESDQPQAHCPGCGQSRKWIGMVQRDSLAGHDFNRATGVKMSPENPRYMAWLNSDATQARFRLPDSHPDRLEPVRKSDDIMHV